MNAAEKARLAKEKEEQARLQRIEEDKKLKEERRQQKKQAITEFRKKHGWQCLAVSSFIASKDFSSSSAFLIAFAESKETISST